jgi:GTP-binding protein Era
MNALLGQDLSVATSKPQTTRKRILGILSEEDYQIIFLDTPGILEPKYMLQEKMLDYVFKSSQETDVLLFMIDIENDKEGNKLLNNESVKKLVRKEKCPKILVINKIDNSNEEEIKHISEKFGNNKNFSKIIPLSAKLKVNTGGLIESLIELLPEHPKYFPDDQLTDANERFFVSEIIRGKIFELYKDEVPYSTEVLIEDFKEREKGKDYILAAIVVEKETQKPIILGKKGEAIKKLGRYSREAIDDFLQREVFLELRVKVREKWRTNPNMLKQYGYSIED